MLQNDVESRSQTVSTMLKWGGNSFNIAIQQKAVEANVKDVCPGLKLYSTVYIQSSKFTKVIINNDTIIL